jgi:hypothetical protein
MWADLVSGRTARRQGNEIVVTHRVHGRYSPGVAEGEAVTD